MPTADLMSLDIFEFDDPNKVAAPVMRLKAPWVLAADANGVQIRVSADTQHWSGTAWSPATVAASVSVGVSNPVSYQWGYLDGGGAFHDITGAVSASFTVDPAGAYWNGADALRLAVRVLVDTGTEYVDTVVLSKVYDNEALAAAQAAQVAAEVAQATADQEVINRVAAIEQEAQARIAAVAGVQAQVDLEKPKVVTLEELSAWYEDLLAEGSNQFVIHDQEIKLVATSVDGATTRIAALEIDSASITQTVAELAPEVAKVAQLRIDVDSVTSSVSDYGTTKSRVSQVEQDVDSVTLLVADLTGPAWSASTAVALDTLVVGNRKSYKCTTAGTSGTTQPSWPGSGTVTDGTVVWTYQGDYVADITQITATKNGLASIAAGSGYYDDLGVFHANEPYSLATQTSDLMTALLAGKTPAEYSLQWATKDEIGSLVTHSELTAEVDAQIAADLAPYETAAQAAAKYLAQTTFTSFTQTQDAINLHVDTLWSGEAPPQRDDREAYLAWLDEAYLAYSAGILVNERLIRLEVQDRSDADETLGSLIEATARSINLAVWGSTTTPSGTTTVVSGIELLKDSIEAQIAGYGAEAYFGMGLELPTLLSSARRDAWLAALDASGDTLVNTLYEWSPGLGMYAAKATASQSDVDSLRDKLKAASLLSSRITLEADEIIMSGALTLKGMFSVDGKLAVDYLDIAGLTAAEAFISGLTVQDIHYQGLEAGNVIAYSTNFSSVVLLSTDSAFAAYGKLVAYFSGCARFTFNHLFRGPTPRTLWWPPCRFELRKGASVIWTEEAFGDTTVDVTVSYGDEYTLYVKNPTGQNLTYGETMNIILSTSRFLAMRLASDSCLMY